MLTWLFDRSMGAPGPTGNFPLWLSVVFHGSNAVTAVLFFLIPVIVSSHWSYRRDGVTRRQYWTVMALFVSLGLRGVVRVLEAWGPPYNLTAVVDGATAVVAVVAVGSLLNLVLHVLRLPSRAEIHRLNDELQTLVWQAELTKVEKTRENRSLLTKILSYEQRLKNEGWSAEKAADLAEIRATLNNSSWAPGDGRGY